MFLSPREMAVARLMNTGQPPSSSGAGEATPVGPQPASLNAPASLPLPATRAPHGATLLGGDGAALLRGAFAPNAEALLNSLLLPPPLQPAGLGVGAGPPPPSLALPGGDSMTSLGLEGVPELAAMLHGLPPGAMDPTRDAGFRELPALMGVGLGLPSQSMGHLAGEQRLPALCPPVLPLDGWRGALAQQQQQHLHDLLQMGQAATPAALMPLQPLQPQPATEPPRPHVASDDGSRGVSVEEHGKSSSAGVRNQHGAATRAANAAAAGPSSNTDSPPPEHAGSDARPAKRQCNDDGAKSKVGRARDPDAEEYKPSDGDGEEERPVRRRGPSKKEVRAAKKRDLNRAAQQRFRDRQKQTLASLEAETKVHEDTIAELREQNEQLERQYQDLLLKHQMLEARLLHAQIASGAGEAPTDGFAPGPHAGPSEAMDPGAAAAPAAKSFK